MIRRALARGLGPAVEAALRRLERGVPVEAHLRLARRALDAAEAFGPGRPEAEIAAAVAAHARARLGVGEAGRSPGAEGALPAPEPGSLRAWLQEGRGGAGTALHLAALLPREPKPRGERPLDPLVRELGEGPAPAAERPVDPREAALLAAALRRGWVAPEAADGALLRAASSLEPRRWFGRTGPPEGAASLLRALLAAPAKGPGEAYVLDVCERLLRHVEVRRGEALRLRGEAALPPGRAALERLRFALALLDAARREGDLRFLNAALKRVDTEHRLLRRRLRGRGPGGPLLRLHYAAAVADQEVLMERLAP